ncbi:hypothetical protein H920_19360 [Fukomys damarensis]|uniref:Uncharacterized protein n=1 Tax=Fukomys damarensis TaxID=885580 RepID=A0A091CMV5_FUKDA|nr:hypothetical protein H920_19360 [Fukomys damarensis]
MVLPMQGHVALVVVYGSLVDCEHPVLGWVDSRHSLTSYRVAGFQISLHATVVYVSFQNPERWLSSTWLWKQTREMVLPMQGHVALVVVYGSLVDCEHPVLGWVDSQHSLTSYRVAGFQISLHVTVVYVSKGSSVSNETVRSFNACAEVDEDRRDFPIQRRTHPALLYCLETGMNIPLAQVLYFMAISDFSIPAAPVTLAALHDVTFVLAALWPPSPHNTFPSGTHPSEHLLPKPKCLSSLYCGHQLTMSEVDT